LPRRGARRAGARSGDHESNLGLAGMTHFVMVQLCDGGSDRYSGDLNEVVETISWGLVSQGHAVGYSINKWCPDPGVVNIFFGTFLLNTEVMTLIPPNSILYNTEPLAVFDEYRDRLGPTLEQQARNFVIWDYSEHNLGFWRSLSPICKVKYVPIGYAPNINKINARSNEDIDVLLYASPCPRRLAAFDHICKSGIKCLFAHGFYGPDRDQLIARSKIVLNIRSEHNRVFEIVRVSYLLSNRKAVVADFVDDQDRSTIEPDLVPAIRLVPAAEVAKACLELLSDTAARERLKIMGHTLFKRRDIRTILQSALD
jgi:hypothetical protein